MDKLLALLIIFSIFLVNPVLNAEIDLLQRPAIESKLIEKNILNDVIKNKDSFLAVGVRGHILNWQSTDKWQQEIAPVSVVLTSVTMSDDGTRVAVGHDSAILLSQANTIKWKKVFDGYTLLELKVELFKKQIAFLKTTLNDTEDADQKEELEYQLEELTFTLEDTQAEQQEGPNKPLLGVAFTTSKQLVAVGAYGTLLVSNDKGNSWALMDDKINNPDKFHLNSVISTTDDKIYVVGENGIGFVSSDAGKSWSSMEMPYPGSLFGIVAQPDSSNLVAFGLQGNLMISRDSGKSWVHKKIDTSASFLGGTVGDDGKAYIVGHGGIILDFFVNDLENITIHKHPSAAAFSNVVIDDDALILTGQFGITSWQLNNGG